MTPHLYIATDSEFKKDGSTLRRIMREYGNVLIFGNSATTIGTKHLKLFNAVLITTTITEEYAKEALELIYCENKKDNDMVFYNWLPLNDIMKTRISSKTELSYRSLGQFLNSVGAKDTPVVAKALMKLANRMGISVK